MSATKTAQTKKTHAHLRGINPIETIADLGSSAVKKTGQELGGIAKGAFDQFLGDFDDLDYGHESHGAPSHQEAVHQQKKKEAKPVFRFHEHHEQVTVKNEIAEIQQLIEQVKQEVAMIKRQNQALLEEVKDVEKLTLSSSREGAKLYDASFLEVILSLLRTLRLKIGESGTWLQAMMSKKKKRGSLFASRTKSMGTQYSLSQELQVTRNVQ